MQIENENDRTSFFIVLDYMINDRLKQIQIFLSVFIHFSFGFQFVLCDSIIHILLVSILNYLNIRFFHLTLFSGFIVVLIHFWFGLIM